jgi:hypothetical protein
MSYCRRRLKKQLHLHCGVIIGMNEEEVYCIIIEGGRKRWNAIFDIIFTVKIGLTALFV